MGQDFGGLLCGLMVVKVNGNCKEITDEVIKIKLRIEEIKEELKEIGEKI